MAKKTVPTLERFEGKIYYDIHEESAYGKRLSREDVTEKAVIVNERHEPWACPNRAGQVSKGHKGFKFFSRSFTTYEYKGLQVEGFKERTIVFKVPFPEWEYEALEGCEVRLEEPGAHLDKKAALFTPEGVRLGTYYSATGGIRPRDVSVYETSADGRRDGWTTYTAKPYGKSSSWEWETDLIPWEDVDLSDPKYFCSHNIYRKQVERLKNAPFKTQAEFLEARAKFEAAVQKAIDDELERLNAGGEPA